LLELLAMYRLCLTLIVFLGGFALTSGITNAADAERQLYEVRTYLLGDSGDEAAIDAYLSDALLPALKRQGIGPVGVLTNAAQDETGVRQIVVVIPYANANQMLSAAGKLASDETYNAAAKDYLARGPKEAPYARIRSELLVAMDCWTDVKVPEGTLSNKDRVYELRLYESPNERLGATKVDMFNAGEVPIFLDCKIQPIFIGQAVIGPQTPSLTYLTVYPNEKARNESWVAFRAHPDWKVLSAEAKYAGTVSRIDKFVMVAKPYSEM
jgi:NIPSNAP